MAIRDDLIDALNDSIDRLNAGEDLERILADYPELTNQLRPMLEAGLLLPRVRYAPPVVEQARDAGEPALNRAIDQTFRAGSGGLITTLLLVLLVAGGLSAGLLLAGGGELFAAPTNTTTHTATSTETSTATQTLTATQTATATQTMTSTATQTRTATATASVIATERVIVPTDTLATPLIVVIEGPVSAVDVNDGAIVIYDVRLDIGDDPRIDVIVVGDILRVEGERLENGTIRIVDILFVDVLVLVGSGEAWRGDNCALPPPDWAREQAGAWFIRCQSQPGSGGTGGSGGGGDNDDDGDDDD